MTWPEARWAWPMRAGSTPMRCSRRSGARRARWEWSTWPARSSAIERDGSAIAGVRLADGRRIAAGWVVNAAGPRAASVAAMVGVELPVRPRKRIVYHFDCRERLGPAPLTHRPVRRLLPAGGPSRGSPATRRARARPTPTRWTWRWIVALRGLRLAGAGPPRAGLRIGPPARRLGGPLRGQHARPQRRHRPAPGPAELPVRQRLLRARPAAGARGRPRPGRVDRHRPATRRSTSARSATSGSSATSRSASSTSSDRGAASRHPSAGRIRRVRIGKASGRARVRRSLGVLRRVDRRS